MPIDIFDTERPAPDRVFRYPIYERFLWLVVVAVALLAAAFFGHIRDFVASEGRRGWIVLGVVVGFLLITVWISLRAWVSKVVISPVSLKARVFGQGVQRISWVHIQDVIYKWRPLGHKLVFVGSDGARVSFRSSIKGHEQLVAFIRENAPDRVLDQLEEIFGEVEEPEEPSALPEEGPEETETPKPSEPAAPLEDEEEPEEEPQAEAEDEPPPEAESRGEESEAEEPTEERRKWWWVFLGR